MKSKKICCAICSVFLALVMAAATGIGVFAKTEPTIVASNLPKSYKIGEKIDFVNITVSNLNDYITEDPNGDYEYHGTVSVDRNDAHQMVYYGGGYGCAPCLIEHETEVFGTESYEPFNEPGKVIFTCDIYKWSVGSDSSTLLYSSAPIEVIVEEPVIETNAPCFVAANSEFDFSSALTNTALENKTVSEFIDKIKDRDSYVEEGWNPVGYQPSVEILEGQNIVAQSNQDYKNILNSSETLNFTGTGIVKLKVKYNQIYNPETFIEYGDDEFYGVMPIGWAPEGEFEAVETETGWIMKENRGEGVLYSPETTVTIYVSENGEADVSIVKEDLNNTLTQAQVLNAADYTAESYNAVMVAMEKANTVLNNPNATVEEVLAAKTELETAVNNLHTGTNLPGGNNGGNSGGNSGGSNNGSNGGTNNPVKIPNTDVTSSNVTYWAVFGISVSVWCPVLYRRIKHRKNRA